MQPLRSVPSPRQAISFVLGLDESARRFFSCYEYESHSSQVTIRETMFLTVDMLINNYYQDHWENVMDYVTLDACLCDVVDQALSDNMNDLCDDTIGHLVHELFGFANHIREMMEPHLTGYPPRRVVAEQNGLCKNVFILIL